MLKIFVVTVALSLSSCPGAIGKALRLWGYTEVRPASTFWEPGTLVWVRHQQPFEAGPLCEAKDVLGEDYKPRESLTMNADMARISKKGVTLDVDVANIVNSNNVINGLSDLKMTLNNGHIFEVTDYDILSRRNRVKPHCLQALRERQRDGYKVTMIASALRADVVYNVTWDRSAKMSLAAKIEALSNLSASLGAEASPQTTNKISGNGLYWGIRDDVYLAHKLLNDEAPPFEPDSRLIPTGLVVSTVQTPDAKGPLPAVLPANAKDPNAQGKLPTTHSVQDGDCEGGFPCGVPTNSNSDRAAGDVPPPQYTLTPADPNDDWDGVVLEPIHEP